MNLVFFSKDFIFGKTFIFLGKEHHHLSMLGVDDINVVMKNLTAITECTMNVDTDWN